jgi:hypothetical protein
MWINKLVRMKLTHQWNMFAYANLARQTITAVGINILVYRISCMMPTPPRNGSVHIAPPGYCEECTSNNCRW